MPVSKQTQRFACLSLWSESERAKRYTVLNLVCSSNGIFFCFISLLFLVLFHSNSFCNHCICFSQLIPSLCLNPENTCALTSQKPKRAGHCVCPGHRVYRHYSRISCYTSYATIKLKIKTWKLKTAVLHCQTALHALSGQKVLDIIITHLAPCHKLSCSDTQTHPCNTNIIKRTALRGNLIDSERSFFHMHFSTYIMFSFDSTLGMSLKVTLLETLGRNPIPMRLSRQPAQPRGGKSAASLSHRAEYSRRE